MRYRFVAAEKANYPLTLLCRTMKVSLSGFYGSSTALAAEQSDEWVSDKCYLNMEELLDAEAGSAAAESELVSVN